VHPFFFEYEPEHFINLGAVREIDADSGLTETCALVLYDGSKISLGAKESKELRAFLKAYAIRTTPFSEEESDE
jgi:hypothetical protein